jgi:hypothetical protein
MRRQPGVRDTLAAHRVIASGLLDATANACYMLATREGLFGIAVLFTSLNPAIAVVARQRDGTTVLARLILGKRMQSVQLTGLILPRRVSRWSAVYAASRADSCCRIFRCDHLGARTPGKGMGEPR